MFDIAKIFKDIFSKDSVLADIFKGKEAKRREFELLLQEHINVANAQQIEINKIEAQHKSIFVSGWRPACGWLCVIALAYSYVIQPFLIMFKIY